MNEKQRRKAIHDHVSIGIGKAQIAARALAEDAFNDAYNYLVEAELNLSIARERIDPKRFFSEDYPPESDAE